FHEVSESGRRSLCQRFSDAVSGGSFACAGGTAQLYRNHSPGSGISCRPGSGILEEYRRHPEKLGPSETLFAADGARGTSGPAERMAKSGKTCTKLGER